MDPAMMGGMPPGMPPTDPMAPPAAPVDPAAAAGGPVKMKPDDRMNQLDYRLYNVQQQLTAIMNALNIQLPAGVLITPPGSPTPVAEAALPGGPQDPGNAAGAGGGDAGQQQDPSGIEAIQALQSFSEANGGGGGQKAASYRSTIGRGVAAAMANLQEPPRATHVDITAGAAAAAALLRSRVQR